MDETLLKALADAEAAAFLNERINRLYTAMCEHDGWLLEAPKPKAQTLAALNAALDAVTEADIRTHMKSPFPPDSNYDKMLELKDVRTKSQPAQPARLTAGSEPTDDTEPQQ